MNKKIYLALLALGAALPTVPVHADVKATAPQDKPQAKTMKTADLIALSGTWKGTNRVTLEPETPVEECKTTIVITPVLKGTMVRLDQKWDWKGDPQEGSMFIRVSDPHQTAKTYWVDTFHTPGMESKGKVTDDGAIDVKGTWSIPPGPDWGWRTIIKSSAPDKLEIIMHNLTPDGKEAGGVEMVLTRE